MENFVVKNTIDINARPEKVWDVLTNPDQTKKYMFGCEAVSDWKEGSALLWQGNYNGSTMVFVKGIILEIEPATRLKYSVIDPNASYADVPENYLKVTYLLENLNDTTLLTVIQDGFEGAAEGEKRYKDTYNNGEGWNPILVQIKQIAEENN